jgi:hypothetical protein
MLELHCPHCGGFIGNPAETTYREAPNATPPVVSPREPSLWERQGGGVHQIRSASRN